MKPSRLWDQEEGSLVNKDFDQYHAATLCLRPARPSFLLRHSYIDSIGELMI